MSPLGYKLAEYKLAHWLFLTISVPIAILLKKLFTNPWRRVQTKSTIA
jgi:hypothetical protein